MPLLMMIFLQGFSREDMKHPMKELARFQIDWSVGAKTWKNPLFWTIFGGGFEILRGEKGTPYHKSRKKIYLIFYLLINPYKFSLINFFQNYSVWRYLV
jgi:hypothetical protein